MSIIDIYISKLNRLSKVAIQILVDAIFITVSLILAMLVRLESSDFFEQRAFWETLIVANVCTLLSLHFLGLYRALIRFLTGKILFIVGKGTIFGAISLYLIEITLGYGIPRSVPIIFGVLAFLSIGGIRFIARTFLRNPAQLLKRPVIIYGAGESGVQLLNSLFHGHEYAPVALVDDNPDLMNLSVGGLKVHASDKIPQLLQTTGAQMVLLAIPSIGRARRREIISNLESWRVEFKTIPDISELITGKAKVSELRSVTPEDLLGRDPVAPDPRLLGKNITDRVVMVSGAGGSIGSELCRQIIRQRPAKLVLFEVSEFSLYTIEAELSITVAKMQYDCTVIPVLGSVQYSRRVEDTIKTFGVQTIYHAAAYKHVPLVEENVVEGVLNNVFGTLAISSAAKKLGVENFILISTDKAVRPTNVMGATKRIAELICQAHTQEASSTVFSMVRFGNVLGSSGSVIPRFRAQIERNEPVTVTHKDVTRYFMTIPEAAQLVIQAGAMAKGGDVFVLDMGDPVKIIDVAIGMIKLYGFQPYFADASNQSPPDESYIPIRITGLRKGEKLYEELLIGNNPSLTRHPRIMTASEVSLPMDTLMTLLDQLRQACENMDSSAIIALLRKLPLDYSPAADL